jgi:hypothetical protein
LHVAAGFRKSLFAVHHPGARSLAQFLDHGSSYRAQLKTPYSSIISMFPALKSNRHVNNTLHCLL